MQENERQRIQEEINEDNIGLIVYVPENTVSMEITVNLLNDETNELYQASCKYPPSLFRECRQEYIEECGRYVLTDYGRQLLEIDDE